MNVHDGIKFPCTECPYISNTISTRYQHAVTHKGLKYECDGCFKQFASSNSMKKHKKYTHGVICYNCKICEYQGSTNGNLQKHQNKYHANP